MMASVRRAFPPWRTDNVRDHDSENWTLGARASFVVKPSLTKTFSARYQYIFLVLLLVANGCPLISARGDFFVQNAGYNWSTDIIFLGGVSHATEPGENSSDGRSQAGSLSLLLNDNSDPTANYYLAGLAYYNNSVRLLDSSTGQSASFNTSFAVDTVSRESPPAGDGFTFVISADMQTIGAYGGSFGLFNQDTDSTSNDGNNFTSIVVEFDSFYNPGFPTYDISDNHVGFDFVNIKSTVAANASTMNVWLYNNTVTFAWVEYSSQTQLLEVRVSNDNSRPITPLLNYTVDLFNVIEEYMWVGFSAGSGGISSDYFVKNWTFESYGIPPSSPTVPSKSSRLSSGLVVGISVGAFAVVLSCIFIVVLVYRSSGGNKRYCRLKWSSHIEEDSILMVEGLPERFSYYQLSVATGNFSDDSKLGRGGFGSVYRGVLPSGIPIAVKKIDGNSRQGEKEFMAEVSIISRLGHRNLIQILGWCSDTAKSNYLLVYELMPNGSLDKVLFGPPEKETVCLSWSQRFNIVMGTATAVEYLHQGWTQQVIHRDIKSSNIMLDEKWNAKLGDSGLARLIDHEKTAPTTLVAGTYGYIAPEMAVSGKFTDKTDVYAFGAVVLEIACGRKALSNDFPEDEMLLVDWVWRRLSNGDLLGTVDERLEDYDTYWMEVLLTIGLLCSHPNALARPTMKHVVQILSGDAPVPSIPASKPALVFDSDYSGFDVSGKLDSEKTCSDSTSSSNWISLVSTNFSGSNRGSSVKSSRTFTKNPS